MCRVSLEKLRMSGSLNVSVHSERSRDGSIVTGNRRESIAGTDAARLVDVAVQAEGIFSYCFVFLIGK